MKQSTIIWVVIGLVLIAGAFLMMGKQQSGLTPTGTTAQASVLKTGSSPELGTYLVSANGMTLYLYTKDAPGVSNCAGQCAINWPPYVVASSASLPVDAGIAGAVSKVTRADGALQVAYNGSPLYFWKDDMKMGDTTGQNVGGVWFVVKP